MGASHFAGVFGRMEELAEKSPVTLALEEGKLCSGHLLPGL